MTKNRFNIFMLAGVSAMALSACATTETTSATPAPQPTSPEMSADVAAQFEADREAILAMEGEFSVTFDFTEFLPIAEGYELKDPKVTPAREVVYVIEDTGEYIALQHLLIVGEDDAPFIVKHWRQDWQYEPTRLMGFTGFNTFEMVDVAAQDAAGAWSQTVYQVDDSPRYGGIGRWEHGVNASTWEPERSQRPLPRRDATTRDDYDAIAAVNRHTVTAWGWTHEQDNSKLVLREAEPYELVREHGINTYIRTDLANDDAAATYWERTEGYWAEIREAWDFILTHDVIVAEDDFDGTLLYGPVLSEGQGLFFGAKTQDEALEAAFAVIEAQVTVDGEALDLD